MNIYNPFSVTNKVVIVTGASSGIGQNVAVELSKMGAIVVGLGRDELKLDLTKELMDNPSNHVFLKVDLTIENQILEFKKKLKSKFSRIDGLVHCAGMSSTILLKSISNKKIENHFSINVFAPLILTKELLDRRLNLFGKKSSIVFISSVMDNHGAKGKSLYGMTKGAIFSGVKSLAIELADKGIRVNSVSPSVVKTPLSSLSYYMSNPETLANINKMHPLGIGEPSDISYSVIYLLSDASRWVTGSNLVVDGGYSIS